MHTPTVGLAGSGPAIEAVRDALADVDCESVDCDPEQVGAADFAVVADDAGTGDDGARAARFAAANRAAREGETPWLAVEIGGLGGHATPDVEAAVSGFAPGTACYECLRTRVTSTLDGDSAADDSSDAAAVRPDAATARFAGALAGREAVTLLSGGESTVLGGVVEIPHAERSVLPVPGCSSCGASPAGDAPHDELDREYADVPLDDALARAEQAVDDRLGPIVSVGEAESFPAPYYLANLASTTDFSDVQAAEQAAGVSADWNDAFVKALGEALERYSAGVYRDSSLERAAPAELDATDRDATVSPSAFVSPDDWPAVGPDDELAWVGGENLHTHESVRLPAEFVHFPPPEARYKPAITTGLGLGNSTVEALLSGLYEAIERDATMLAWYSTFEPLGLAVEHDRFETLVKHARAEDLAVTPLLVTQDVDVPVVAVAVHRAGGDWPRFAVGSGADLDPDAAAADALGEALQNWMELRSMGCEDAADQDGAIGAYADFPPAAREFVDVETRVPSHSVGPASVPDGDAALDAVLDRLADADLDAYAARLTTRDVDRLGFEAVRVLVPAAQPLFTDEPFFGERAERVPAELGFAFDPDREHHPYP